MIPVAQISRIHKDVGSAGKCSVASGRLASQSSTGMARCMPKATSLNNRPARTSDNGSKTTPSKETGIINRLINGMNSRLASGDTRLTWPNTIASTGNIPMIISSCIRPCPVNFLSCCSLPRVINRMMPTARKDIQKPGSEIEKG